MERNLFQDGIWYVVRISPLRRYSAIHILKITGLRVPTYEIWFDVGIRELFLEKTRESDRVIDFKEITQPSRNV